ACGGGAEVPAILAAILHHPGKGGAQVVAANGQFNGSEEHSAAAFNRADCHARSVVKADVQVSVGGIAGASAETLHARRAARRITKKTNDTARLISGTPRTGVGDHGGVACGRGVVEIEVA